MRTRAATYGRRLAAELPALLEEQDAIGRRTADPPRAPDRTAEDALLRRIRTRPGGRNGGCVIVIETGECERVEVERVAAPEPGAEREFVDLAGMGRPADAKPPAGLDLELVGVTVLALADRLAALEMRVADLVAAEKARSAWTLDGTPVEIEAWMRQNSARLTVGDVRDVLALAPGGAYAIGGRTHLLGSGLTVAASVLRRVR